MSSKHRRTNVFGCRTGRSTARSRAPLLAMVIVIPIELGGYGKMFAMIPPAKLLLAAPKDGNLGQFSAYATLALGSAFALFLYPHTMTGVFSSSGREVIRRNAAWLPVYSFMLGLL